MTGVLDPKLLSETPLFTGDAVAAIIRVDEDGYLMQLRDSRPDIWYPGRWNLFGGAVEPGEEPMAALHRELREELELEFVAAEFFGRFDFDAAGAGLTGFYRSYYIVSISREVESRLVLHEGAGKKVFSGRDILLEPNIAPYDAFALFLYDQRARLNPAG
ncbi:MAG TPA: NUDIX domain-containing protein [Stellaceae bacterium]|nr:NUDIX domain-containing protein [Stellaceae bacterium]